MSLTRRGLLGSLICAPAIIRTPGLIMPIKVMKKAMRRFQITSVSFNGQRFDVSGHSIEEGGFVGLTMNSGHGYAVGDIIMVEDLFA